LLDETAAGRPLSGHLGERWVWVILRQRSTGAQRFEDFSMRGIGLARNCSPTASMGSLITAFCQRRRYASTLPATSTEYRLTAKGRARFRSTSRYELGQP